MRFGLRTLMIALAEGPPILAGAWAAEAWIDKNPATAVVLGLLLGAYLVALTIAVYFKRLLRAAFSLLRREKSK